MTAPLAVRLRRRHLLSAAAVTAASLPLAACDDVPLDASGTSNPPDEAAAPDPEAALLAETVRAEEAMVASLRAMSGRGPARRRRLLEQTIAMHEAHLQLLDGERTTPSPGPGPGPTWRVVGAEERLSRRHAEAAVRAASGQFARVLAGMAAAAAQQAEVWRRTTGAAS